MMLYDLPISSSGAKARIAFALKGVSVESLPPPDGYGSPAYRAIVPAATIPALVDGDFVLSESSAILEWIEEVFPTPTLLPGDAHARAKIRQMAAFHDTGVDPPLRALFRAPPPDVAAPSIRRALDRMGVLETLLDEDGPFACGASVTLADCGLPITLLIADEILPRYGAATPTTPRLVRARHAWAGHPVIGAAVATYRIVLAAWAAERFRNLNA
ncbi:glutathione S-transferase family protein [Humitalea sp. 24SJ18S-53]|uniref:glutathione S-transferase family protein n=1 Tax=Humitalea sp. 24SJ18S-53 TaxID=3422307 RepID=UPI003D672779